MKTITLVLLSLLIYGNSSGQCYKKVALTEGVTSQEVVSITLQQIPAGTYVSGGIYLTKTNCPTMIESLPFLEESVLDNSIEYSYSIPTQNNRQFPNLRTNEGSRSGDPCAGISDLVTEMMNTMDTSMARPEQCGSLATDSIIAFNTRMRDLHIQGKLVLTVPEVSFTTDTTSYLGWLSSVFTGASTTTDSIEKLCKWVPAHYAYDEYDPRSDTLSADSMYYMILRYELRGQCGDYATFVAKVSRHFPSWGYPIVLNGRSDTSIPGSGQQPSHVFLGFAKKSGKIWIITDPTIGGVVRDTYSGSPITYDVFRSWIRHPKRSLRVAVQPATTTVQMWGQCALSVSFRDTVGLEFFSTGVLASDGLPADITRGHWFTYGEPGGGQYCFYAEYWKAAGYPKNCIYNIYDHATFGGGVLFNGTPIIANRIGNRYGFPVGLH